MVIATGTEDTTALEAGLKSIEGLTLDYLAGPPDATAAELTALEKWVKDRRAAYFTEFQPTHPVRGATANFAKKRELKLINLFAFYKKKQIERQRQRRLCSVERIFMLFGCGPAGEGVSSWTSHATKSKVRLEGRSAYSQSARSSAHSDFPGNKSGDCPVRGP